MVSTRFVLFCAAVAGLSAPAAAQRRFPPDSFTNLKVLPKTIDQRTLLNTMRGFAMALGVRCAYCHVAPREDAPLDSIDFAKDDKRTKRVARVMLDMVHHINEEHLADVPERPTPKVEVRCVTCHRGVARPRLLDEDDGPMLELLKAAQGVSIALPNANRSRPNRELLAQGRRMLATLRRQGELLADIESRHPGITKARAALPASAWTSMTLGRAGGRTRRVKIHDDPAATL